MTSSPQSPARIVRRVALGLIAALLLAQPALAQSPSDDLAALEAFVDGVIEAQLEAHAIPGATVAVVADGEVRLARGYGYADLAAGRPFDAERTLTRAGSVAKLFTWTAVMQLVEAGKLDLHADVNTYLTDLRIPDTYPEPVTLAHLLTHSAGFEDRSVGTWTRDAATLQPLDVYLAQAMPARVRPPGALTDGGLADGGLADGGLAAYSNHGTSLAGQIVAEVSGMAFEDYVATHIFEPLGMDASTFAQPLPPALAERMATGYTFENGLYVGHDLAWVRNVPAGALSTTAADVARFMIAHLQEGRIGETRILAPETVRMMHTRHFAHSPEAGGWTYGFMEIEVNGERILWHGGTMRFHHTALALLPEHGIGLFVSYNAPAGTDARTEFVDAFIDHYVPAPLDAGAGPAGDVDPTRFAGEYLPTRANQTTPEKLYMLLNRLHVRPYGERALRLSGPLGGGSVFEAVDPHVFRNRASGAELVFTGSPGSGRGDRMVLTLAQNPMSGYVRAPWYAAFGVQVGVPLVASVLFLTALIGWPAAWLRRRSERAGPHARPVRWVAWTASALSLTVLVGIAVPLGDPMALQFGFPPALRAVLALPPVIGVLALAGAYLVGRMWQHRDGSFGARLHTTLVVLAGLAFTAWLAYWNLSLFHL